MSVSKILWISLLLLFLMLHGACIVVRLIVCHLRVLMVGLLRHWIAVGVDSSCSEKALDTGTRLQALRHARSVNTARLRAAQRASTGQIFIFSTTACLSVCHWLQLAFRWIELHVNDIIVGVFSTLALILKLTRDRWLHVLILLHAFLGSLMDLSWRLHKVLHLKMLLFLLVWRLGQLLRHHIQVLLRWFVMTAALC